ncbi:MAG: hypothetical protein IT449_07035 [Phycisphaerales bacterium]|nr:hypothetical protein [Phycisphaerales bacterium]
MPAPAIVRRMTLYPLRIPLRGAVEHARATRSFADPIVVKVELAGGGVGYGETLPRPYVTGEDRESALRAMQGPLLDAVMAFHADSLSAALEALEALPWGRDSAERVGAALLGETSPSDLSAGAGFPSARAGVELALLDASLRHFRRSMAEVAGWMGLTFAGPAGASGRAGKRAASGSSSRAAHPRFSGVLASGDLGRTLRQLRLMRLGGLRDFKLKVGDDGDEERLRAVLRKIGRAIARGRATLRLDANGAWTPTQARERLVRWKDFATAGEVKNALPDGRGSESGRGSTGANVLALAGIEQPLPRGGEADLPALRGEIGWPLIHDESLVTQQDAQRLMELGVADVFNIRLSKCGGMLASLRLASLAWRGGARIQLGCMVGETSILSGAGLRFLEVCPHVEWAEGCFGTRLLTKDVTRRSLKFGYAGKPPAVTGFGWGAGVDERTLAMLSDPPPIELHLG